jgi:ribonucleoside-diphosphate reductase alpha chain
MATTVSAKIEALDTTKITTPTRAGIEFERYFTARLAAETAANGENGKTPYDEVQWETRTATIGNDKASAAN